MYSLTCLFALSMLLVVATGYIATTEDGISQTPMPAPLAEETVASCPVTLPNVSISPNEYYVPTSSSIENAERTLFTIPWPEGRVIFRSGGPGLIGSDGSLAMKWPWIRYDISGQLTIEGRRLDAAAPPLRAEMPCCYGDTGFQPSTLIFSSEGCWEVTGRVGDHSLTFVTLVVKVESLFDSRSCPSARSSWRSMRNCYVA